MYRSNPIQRSLPAEAPPLLTEVDARTLVGNGGTVTLYLCAGAPRYLVDVANAKGEEIANIAVTFFKASPLSGTPSMNGFFSGTAEKNTLNLAGNLGVIVGSSGVATGHTFNLPGVPGPSTEAKVESFIQGTTPALSPPTRTLMLRRRSARSPA